MRYATNGGKTFRPVGRDLNRSNLLISDFTNPTSAPIQFSPAYGSDHTVYAIAAADHREVHRRRADVDPAEVPERADVPRTAASRIATPPSTGTVRATAPTSAMPDVKNNSSNGVWYIVAIGAGAGLVLLGVYLWSRSRAGLGSDATETDPAGARRRGDVVKRRRALVVHTRMPAFDRDAGSQVVDNIVQFLLARDGR